MSQHDAPRLTNEQRKALRQLLQSVEEQEKWDYFKRGGWAGQRLYALLEEAPHELVGMVTNEQLAKLYMCECTAPLSVNAGLAIRGFAVWLDKRTSEPSERCLAAGCTKSPARAAFCEEHNAALAEPSERLADCEASLRIYDPGQTSEYWLRHAEKSAEVGTRVTVGCSQCTATVSLPQHEGMVDITSLGLWYFSTPTGWRCPAHAPAQRTNVQP